MRVREDLVVGMGLYASRNCVVLFHDSIRFFRGLFPKLIAVGSSLIQFSLENGFLCHDLFRCFHHYTFLMNASICLAYSPGSAAIYPRCGYPLSDRYLDFGHIHRNRLSGILPVKVLFAKVQMQLFLLCLSQWMKIIMAAARTACRDMRDYRTSSASHRRRSTGSPVSRTAGRLSYT